MRSSAPLGRRTWVFPGGHVPPESTGHEPEYTSREELDLLNDGDADAAVEVTIYYEDSEPVGPYPIHLGARRVRHVRVNDLIDPQAVPLGVPFGAVVRSDVPIVAQLTRTDTRRGQIGLTVAPGFCADE